MKMHLVSLIFLILICLSSLTSSFILLSSNTSLFIDWEIFNMNSSYLSMSLIIDWVSMMFLSFVSFISSMVLYYSGSYMKGDENMNRFMYLVLSFVMSMGLLIISPNLISILLGWDGLGLVSYLLVIYYGNEKSANAGMLTALSNRIGDVCILLSIALMCSLGGWNYIFYVGSSELSKLSLVFLIMMAAMTKSAQIPFSAWLPAAMAAPTPVSALVHSSTLVTAGVYMLIRFNSALEGTLEQSILLLVASLTMFMAGLGANFENDLKKIIALSTLSQLGVMLSILALGWPELAFFHLLTHALFKALLFMCAGSIIHNVSEYQDIRKMGSLVQFMPLSASGMNLANLSLCGMPYLAGFYSKDLILEVAFLNSLNMFCFWLLLIATGLTCSYTFRLIYYTMTSDYNLNSMSSLSDNDMTITGPILSLSVISVLSGSVLSWLIFPYSFMICLSPFFKSLILVVCVLSSFVGYYLNKKCSVNSDLKSLFLYNMTVFSGSMWFMVLMSSQSSSKGVLKNSGFYLKLGDMGWSEYYGGYNMYNYYMKSSVYLQKSQDNSIKLLMISLVMWMVFLLLYYW